MGISPFHKFEIMVNKQTSDVCKILASETTPPLFWKPKIFHSLTGKEKFKGKVYQDHFTIRLRKYSHYCPIIHGQINSCSNVTIIEANLNFHPSTIMFLIIWFFVAPFGSRFIYVDESIIKAFIFPTLIPIIILYSLSLYQMKKTKEAFLEILAKKESGVCP